jgi:hypothetical protein
VTFRRWLAGLIGEVSQWLQDKLWPTYSKRHPTTPLNAEVLAWMESRGWNN